MTFIIVAINLCQIIRPQRLQTAKLCEAEFVLFLCGIRNLLSSSKDASPPNK